MFFKKAKQIDELSSTVKQKTNYISELETKVSEMEKLMTPDMREVISLQDKIKDLQSQLDCMQSDYNVQKAKEEQKLLELRDKESGLLQKISVLKSQLVETDEKVLLQEFGLYEPKFDFVSSDAYKARLSLIREQQKAMIKTGTAIIGATSWTVNGSASQGSKMIKDIQKLVLRAFNSECDECVVKVKYNTYDSYVQRIEKSCQAISKLGAIMNLSISEDYKRLKLDELALSFEYKLKKEEEKEAQKALRAQMREEAKLQKEIEEARKKLDKEQTHYEKALSAITKQLEIADDETKKELLAKQKEIENQLGEIEKAQKDVDYRAANAKAGYVYIISNIGAFGENVYKIGMTRRLDPTERVDELGDASVPFNFDIHAMIFSDDAPRLEAALHRAFEGRKLNMVNQRREFFRVTLDEIKEVVKANFDKTVEFVDVAEAEQYRTSEKMRMEMK